MLRVTIFVAAIWTLAGTASADVRAKDLPNFSIEQSCSALTGHPHHLALCREREVRYRNEARASWDQSPPSKKGFCVARADQSKARKYGVLAQCLRVAAADLGAPEAQVQDQRWTVPHGRTLILGITY
ncbi:MAG: hypothetical protein FWD08_05230 [Alphaproteobacteria bacterium]|nr:hypothetical protein [Alphaproteobacteria bacterium]